MPVEKQFVFNLHIEEGYIVPLVCYVSERDVNAPLDADRLLRLLGASGKLSGFYYAVYMLEQVKQNQIMFYLSRSDFTNKLHSTLEQRVTA